MVFNMRENSKKEKKKKERKWDAERERKVKE